MSHTAQTTDRPLRTLVLGGARSGKSALAEQLAEAAAGAAGRDGAVRYIATAVPDPGDRDFLERIAAHRARRPGHWTVVEGDPIAALGTPAAATLIDDLGTWLTARVDARAAWGSPRGTLAPDFDALVAAVTAYEHPLVIVSPEVGLSVVPSSPSGRLFRDELGTLNQLLAAVCDEVYLVVAGQPLRLKPDLAGAATAVVTGAVAGVPAAQAFSASDAEVQGPADFDVAQVEGVEAAGAQGVSAAEAVSPEVLLRPNSVQSQVRAAGTAGGAESKDEADAPATGAGSVPAGGAAGNGAAAAAAVAVGAGVGVAGDSAGGLDFSKKEVAEVSFGAVPGPDAAVRLAAAERQGSLTKPGGALGRLERLANWVAACQGVCPPRQFERARVVVFAGDHGVAEHGVSAYPSAVTGQMVANFLAGGAAVNVLARVADATVRVEDIAVQGDTAPEISRHKVRRSSGSIDREDALTAEQVRAALTAGVAIADEEIDSGADLLIAGDMGIGNTTPATVLIATITDTEPVIAVGRGTGVDDAGWIRKTAAIRDAMWRARPFAKEPIDLLRTASGADFAAMAGFLARAAERRTPVILDGVVVTAAALVANQLASGASEWWVAGHRSSEPSHKIALDRLGMEPLLEMEMRLGEGSGALTALPLLRAAVATLGEMATFAEAGVSTADAPETAGA
ncbi:nicotinate-nucleotide--dimethylbenzimidazole phosphoribosyltransferase [Nocardia sp. NPDC057668]|uniref:nicotinate-nucleotide--dimethylbenzimidazole phosphoribosyltransferase n=1 Tax=Nocardia sp. NPDC057668 TaxID=3346202 RepID=UPI00366C65E6